MDKKYRKQITVKRKGKDGKYRPIKVSLKDLENLGHRIDGLKSCTKCHRNPCNYVKGDNLPVINMTKKKPEPVKVKKVKPKTKKVSVKKLSIKQNEKKIKALEKQLHGVQEEITEEIKKTKERIEEQKNNYTNFRNYLDERDVEVLKYFYEKGYTTREIAKIMKRAKSTIASHIKKLKEKGVQKGEVSQPSYEVVREQKKNKEFDGRADSTTEIPTEEKKESDTKKEEKTHTNVEPVENNGNKEPAVIGSIVHIFEVREKRKCDFTNKADRAIYNDIYQRVRHGNLDPVKDIAILMRDETDDERAKRIRNLHEQGLDANGQPMKNIEEHNEAIGTDESCVYCDEGSRFEGGIETIKNQEKNNGYTQYDVFIRNRNFARKRWAEILTHKSGARPVPKQTKWSWKFGQKLPQNPNPEHEKQCECKECVDYRKLLEEAKEARNQWFAHDPRLKKGKPEPVKPEPTEPKDVVKQPTKDFFIPKDMYHSMTPRQQKAFKGARNHLTREQLQDILRQKEKEDKDGKK